MTDKPERLVWQFDGHTFWTLPAGAAVLWAKRNPPLVGYVSAYDFPPVHDEPDPED